MADEEHLAILRQGVEVWNDWRVRCPRIIPDLSGADLAGTDLNEFDLEDVNFDKACLSRATFHFANLTIANLNEADLSNADLSFANLHNANLLNANLGDANLSKADLSYARLYQANLRRTNLKEVNFNNASLSGADLTIATMQYGVLYGADLSFATLEHVNLYNANLYNVDLSNANLSHAYLAGANLSETNFTNSILRGTRFNDANLSKANLHEAQVIEADFTGATLTGACITDWQISSSTNLSDVICDYIYRAIDQEGQFSGRLPVDPKSTFGPSEFTQRFQILASAQETIDLTFTEGIDWQAFFHSFQELRSQNPDTEISIQGMERKAEGFIVRLEVNQEADKATIETQAKQLYAQQLQLLEAQYEERLRLQGAHLEDIRELLSFERQERTRLSKVVETMASEQQTPKYDLRGAQFAGGFAEVVKGNQYGGTINNHGANLDEITRLLTTLREQVQTFPSGHKEEALDLIDDLEADLQKSEPDPDRIGRRLKRLAAVATTVGTLTAGAVSFSGNLNEFTGNVVELTETLGIPIEQVQSNTDQISP